MMFLHLQTNYHCCYHWVAHVTSATVASKNVMLKLSPSMWTWFQNRGKQNHLPGFMRQLMWCKT